MAKGLSRSGVPPVRGISRPWRALDFLHRDLASRLGHAPTPLQSSDRRRNCDHSPCVAAGHCSGSCGSGSFSIRSANNRLGGPVLVNFRRHELVGLNMGLRGRSASLGINRPSDQAASRTIAACVSSTDNAAPHGGMSRTDIDRGRGEGRRRVRRKAATHIFNRSAFQVPTPSRRRSFWQYDMPFLRYDGGRLDGIAHGANSDLKLWPKIGLCTLVGKRRSPAPQGRWQHERSPGPAPHRLDAWGMYEAGRDGQPRSTGAPWRRSRGVRERHCPGTRQRQRGSRAEHALVAHESPRGSPSRKSSAKTTCGILCRSAHEDAQAVDALGVAAMDKHHVGDPVPNLVERGPDVVRQTSSPSASVPGFMRPPANTTGVPSGIARAALGFGAGAQEIAALNQRSM